MTIKHPAILISEMQCNAMQKKSHIVFGGMHLQYIYINLKINKMTKINDKNFYGYK